MPRPVRALHPLPNLPVETGEFQDLVFGVTDHPKPLPWREPSLAACPIGTRQFRRTDDPIGLEKVVGRFVPDRVGTAIRETWDRPRCVKGQGHGRVCAERGPGEMQVRGRD